MVRSLTPAASFAKWIGPGAKANVVEDHGAFYLKANANATAEYLVLLDVGCNEGRGLTMYAGNGFQAEGLELNRVAADAARQKGFVVVTPAGSADPLRSSLEATPD